MRSPLLTVLAATALVATALAPPAAAWSPSQLGSAETHANFARAFGLEPGDVVDAQAFDLPATPDTPGFILGRYREHGRDTAWTFPGLALYFRCAGGFCLSRAYLGSAATRLVPLAAVDLDAARTDVPLALRWQTGSAAVPTAATAAATATPTTTTTPTTAPPHPPARHPPDAHWPAVALAIERAVPDAGTDLVLVSLRHPEAPDPALELVLETRTADATEAEMRGPTPRPATVPIGLRLEALRLEHTGADRRATATMRPIDSRWNPCLRTEAYTVAYALDDAAPADGRPRYRPAPDNPPPTRPCH